MEDEANRDEGQASEPAPKEDEASLLRAVPGMARIAAAAYWRSARWTVKASAEATQRVLRAAVTGQEPAELFRSTEAEIRERTRRVLGLPESRGPEPPSGADAAEAEREQARQSLRERGEELLRRSADVNFEEDAHPAYMQGPQPSVDVRSGLVPLKSTSELIAAGLNMIGPEAGCRHLEDVPAYLNNLFRLGLIWFSSESVRDPLRYQVLEAQPEVTEALKSAGHTRTVRRSIHLTPFGRDFCNLCLPAQVREPDAGEDGDAAG
jgi:hypothetical protein